DREDRRQGPIGLARLLYGAGHFDPVTGRQFGNDRLQLLPHGAGDIRRLQALGDIATHGDGWGAVAAAQDGIFHADINLADLRQRNLLTARTDQGEVANPAWIEPRVAARTGCDLHRTDVLAHFRNRDTTQQELQLLGHIARR